MRAIHRGAVHEHERRPFADALERDLEPVRPNDVHLLNLPAAGAELEAFSAVEPPSDVGRRPARYTSASSGA